MAHNRDQLARRALKELRLIGEGQAASAHDMAEALHAIGPLLERLKWLNIYEPLNPFVFADAVFHCLSVLLAEDLAVSIGGRARNQALVDHHQDQLRRICRQPLDRNELVFDAALCGTGKAAR